MKQYRRDNPTFSAETQRAYNRRIRQEVLDAYGNRCKCCGETTPQFLALDHVFNDGAEHRERIGGSGGMRVYLDVRRRGFPQDRYQLLCHNCNCAKGFYGKCPHKMSEAELAVAAEPGYVVRGAGRPRKKTDPVDDDLAVQVAVDE